VNLALGSTVRLDITLQSESVITQVTVTAQPPAIELAQTSVTSAVDTERIEELPVESRNYLNFSLLAPSPATHTRVNTFRTRMRIFEGRGTGDCRMSCDFPLIGFR
jgi:hypothetical protein